MSAPKNSVTNYQTASANDDGLESIQSAEVIKAECPQKVGFGTTEDAKAHAAFRRKFMVKYSLARQLRHRLKHLSID